MKTLLFIGCLVGITSGAFGQQQYFSPSQYRNMEPTTANKRTLAGSTDFIQDGPRYNITEYFPGLDQQIALDKTNNVVIFTSVGALTNVIVLFPNPTNNARAGYRLIANGNVTMKLSNTFGTTFKTPTNTVAATFTSVTNRSMWVYNLNRTNWFIDLDLP